jgi:ABC-type antimicrobial peptide transport system ATPase subunit
MSESGFDERFPITGAKRFTRRKADEYASPHISCDEAHLLALELLQQFDGQPVSVIRQVLRQADQWLDAVTTLSCGEATEFARAVEVWQRAAGESL